MEYTVNGDSLVDHKEWPQYTDSMLADQMDSLKKSLNKR